MRKPAESAYLLSESIRERWSPLAFSSQGLEKEVVGSLLEAARWAPSCFNEQPWRFVVAQSSDSEAFERVAECLVPGNRAWAEKAPLLMITVARDTYERNGKDNAWSWHDVGLATAQLILQAQTLGLAAHVMAGFDPVKARDLLAIPEGFTPVSCRETARGRRKRHC